MTENIYPLNPNICIL